MNLASEMAGSDALARIQDRAAAYWSRQLQKRLVSSLSGVIAGNIANNSSDMVLDIHAAKVADVAAGTLFSAEAVIDAAAELGDNLDALSAIAMHSDVYRAALKADLIATVPDSDGRPIRTYRGLAVIVDDGLPYTPAAGSAGTDNAAKYTTVLFGKGAVGYGVSEPRIAAGTEVENLPSAGKGGGQQVLHSRVNLAVHPAGFQWVEGTIAADSPSLAELAAAAHWTRVYERKAIPLAFLITNG